MRLRPLGLLVALALGILSAARRRDAATGEGLPRRAFSDRPRPMSTSSRRSWSRGGRAMKGPGQEGRTMKQSGARWLSMSVLGLVVWLATFLYILSIGPSEARAAEEVDITHCYSGTATIFHEQSKEALAAASWTQNGITMSHHDKKILDNAVVHCEGVQRGLGPERTGYGLCKIMDSDSDVINAEIPYSGFDYQVKFVEGTGKWKGVKGTLESRRTVRSLPGKGAMPGTYQGCRREKGTIELSR